MTMEAVGVSGDEGEEGEEEEDDDDDDEDEVNRWLNVPQSFTCLLPSAVTRSSRGVGVGGCDGESRVVWRKVVLVWMMGDVVLDKGGRWERASRYGFCSRNGR